MTRRFTDNPRFQDFRDLAVIMLTVDGIGGILFLVIWHL